MAGLEGWVRYQMFISYLRHSNLDPLLIALVECSIFIFMIIFQTILTMETYYYFHVC